MVTLNNVLTFRLRQYVEQNGNLLPIEFDKTIPFKPKRTFFVCNVPDQQIRGCHLHTKFNLGRTDISFDRYGVSIVM